MKKVHTELCVVKNDPLAQASLIKIKIRKNFVLVSTCVVIFISKRVVRQHVTMAEMNKAGIVVVKHVQHTNCAKKIRDIRHSGLVA